MYDGSDAQIAEMCRTGNTFITRDSSGKESDPMVWIDTANHPDPRFRDANDLKRDCERCQVTHYWIIPDDPLREMKIRQAQTGQPVWIKTNPFDWECAVPTSYVTTTPDWNITNAEYSFTAFQE